MSVYPDLMVDLETTGANKDHNAIIQIAAVRFDLKARTIDTTSFFDRCLTIPNNRYWMESTRNWWMEKPEILQSLWKRMEPTEVVLKDFYDFVGQGKTMWAKPTHFDHAFLDSYYQEYGPQMPLHYRSATDINSFIRGRYWPETPPKWEYDLPFEGPVHNAIFDCLHQIKVLFKVTEDTVCRQVASEVVEGPPW